MVRGSRGVHRAKRVWGKASHSQESSSHWRPQAGHTEWLVCPGVTEAWLWVPVILPFWQKLVSEYPARQNLGFTRWGCPGNTWPDKASFKAWKCPIEHLPTAAPSSSLHPDYFITICLQAGIALLKPQIIIITIIRNSCGGGVGTPSKNVWVCPLAVESLLLGSGNHKAGGFHQSQLMRRLSAPLTPPVKRGMRWGSFF